MNLKGLIFLLFFLPLTVANAGSLSVEDAQRFMYVSGLQKTIDSMPEQIRQQINLRNLLADDENANEKVGRLLGEAISEVDGQQLTLSYLLSHPHSDNLINTLNFFDTDLGKAIFAAEDDANNSDAQIEIQKYAQIIATTPPTENRVKLIQSLLASLHIEETMLNIVKGMMYTTADIMTEIKPEAASQMKAEVEAQWQKMEPILSAQMTQYLVVAYHYTYRNISDQELTDYNQFLLSPDGQVYWSVSIEIVNRYLKTFSENLVRKLTSTH